MNFNKSKRQAIIDGYLATTGKNLFIASEFIDWLQDEPEHEAYPWFFGKDDAEAARDYRIDLARRMAGGMRIVVSAQEATQSGVVQINVREYPAYVSAMSGRKAGGGYSRFDPDDAESLAELRRQGATALRSWLLRYRGAFSDTDLSAIEEIAASQDESVAVA